MDFTKDRGLEETKRKNGNDKEKERKRERLGGLRERGCLHVCVACACVELGRRLYTCGLHSEKRTAWHARFYASDTRYMSILQRAVIMPEARGEWSIGEPSVAHGNEWTTRRIESDSEWPSHIDIYSSIMRVRFIRRHSVGWTTWDGTMHCGGEREEEGRAGRGTRIYEG